MSGGQFTLIDVDLYVEASKINWTRSTRGYVVSSRKDGPAIYLHHLVVGGRPAGNLVVDHRNHDQMDNRRANLRVVTKARNSANGVLLRSNTSGYRGVNHHKGLWRARVTVDKRRMLLGDFEDKDMAALAVDLVSLRHFGEDAFLNFPDLRS